MALHTIRLRAPWKRWQEGECSHWERPFGRPTNLSEDEVVRLVLRSDEARAVAVLNGKVLGNAPGVYDVTGRLARRNTIVLRMEGDDRIGCSGAEPPLDVRLEIASGLPEDDPVS